MMRPIELGMMTTQSSATDRPWRNPGRVATRLGRLGSPPTIRLVLDLVASRHHGVVLHPHGLPHRAFTRRSRRSSSPATRRRGPMPKIVLMTLIHAPPERCFDLSRSVELHVASTRQTGERAVGAVTSGLLGLGEEVTW